MLLTRTVFAVGDAPGDARVTYTFDDVALDVTQVDWHNNAPQPFYYELHRTSDGTLASSGVVGVGASGSRAVPAGQVKMVAQLDPVDHVQGFVPPFSVYCRYPA